MRKKSRSPFQTGTEITYLAKLISDISRSIDRGQDPTNGIWNDPVYLVMLSALTQRWKIMRPKTNWCALTPITIERKRQQPQFLTDFILLPIPATDKNWVSQHIVCYVVHLWKVMQCKTQFWHILFVNGRFTECFHFPVLQHFCLCLMHVSIKFAHQLWHRQH